MKCVNKHLTIARQGGNVAWTARPSRLPDETYLEARDPPCAGWDVPPNSCAPVRWFVLAWCLRVAAWSRDEEVETPLRSPRPPRDVRAVEQKLVHSIIGSRVPSACISQMRQMHTSWSAHREVSFPGIRSTKPALRETPLFSSTASLAGNGRSTVRTQFSHLLSCLITDDSHALNSPARPVASTARALRDPHEPVPRARAGPARRPLVHRVRARASCGPGNLLLYCIRTLRPRARRTARLGWPLTPPTCADTLGAALELPVRRESRRRDPSPAAPHERGAADGRAACACA